MINLVTGLPGSGKTLWTLKTVVDYVAKENKALEAQGKPPRQIFYHGIPELTLTGWTLMDSPEDWITLPSHSIIVIDECQSTFRPRAASVKPPPYVADFETHRHKGLDFFLMTQHPMLIDGNIRRLAGKHYHVVRFYGFQKSTIHEFQQVRENCDKNLKNSISTHFVYPKEVFNWYKSADAHTVKKRVPMRLIMIVLMPILAVVLAYFAVQSLYKIQTDPIKKIEKTADVAATDNQNYNHGLKTPNTQIQTDRALTYVELHTPEVPDFPHTMPIYADITKPTSAPFPSACVMSNSKGCQCFTQQGTKMNIEYLTCKHIVENGVYVDWDVNPQRRQDAMPDTRPQQVASIQPEQTRYLSAPLQMSGGSNASPTN
jgi:hypothetical protein